MIRAGEFNPNILDQKVEIQPFENALRVANNKINNYACLKRLNYLLEFIDKNNQKFLPKYVGTLKTAFQNLLREDFLGDNKSILSKIFEEREFLQKYPELTKNTLNFNLQLLKLSSDINWMDDIVEVKQGDYIRSFLIPNYYYLLLLTKTIDREEAIKLFKRYVTHYLIDQIPSSNVNFTTLEDKFEKRKKSKNQSPSAWVTICGLLQNGKYFYRNDNCLWIDALEDLPDRELKYYVCCYGDYQNAKRHNNENIILTMEHTIAQGDQYCSRVLHDTRIDWDLTHPPKEFWDSIWPLHEWQKKD